MLESDLYLLQNCWYFCLTIVVKSKVASFLKTTICRTGQYLVQLYHDNRNIHLCF